MLLTPYFCPDCQPMKGRMLVFILRPRGAAVLERKRHV